MRGNGRAFVSHAYQDNGRCQPLLAALASWGVDTWFQVEREEADEQLSPRVEQDIAERDLFIRICSADADRSHWVRLETETFRRLQAAERTTEGAEAAGDSAEACSEADGSVADGARPDSTERARTLIFFRIDAAAERPSLEDGDLYVDAAGISVLRWRPELRRALGMRRPAATIATPLADDASDDPGTETAALPRVTRHDLIDDLRALAEQLRLHGPEDSVVKVAIADRSRDDSTAVLLRAATLEVIEGSDTGRKYALHKDCITLGRKMDRDIFLMDLAASRRHASIERDEQGHFLIRDDHSTNGTFVNERPVLEQALEDGDLIRLGRTTFRLRLPRRDD